MGTPGLTMDEGKEVFSFLHGLTSCMISTLARHHSESQGAVEDAAWVGPNNYKQGGREGIGGLGVQGSIRGRKRSARVGTWTTSPKDLGRGLVVSRSNKLPS